MPRPARGSGRSPVRPLLLALSAVVAVLVAVAAAGLVPALPRAAATLGPAVLSGTDARAAEAAPDPAPEQVAPGVERRTLSYGPGGLEHEYDVYLPTDGPVRARPTVLLLHGGSWEIGDKVEWDDEGVALAQRGWTAVSVNYRRTPTAPWPAPLEDVRTALAHLQARAGELGIDVERTGALGDSVGAQLAALLGRPTPGLVPVRAVVAWSGVNDMPGLLAQPSSGGCAATPCRYRGLARKVVRDLMRCAPDSCPGAYREASPAADLVSGPATFSVNGEQELIDPRQAWAIDGALSRAGIASRVAVLQGGVHGRGNQPAVWADSLRFLEATLLPETTPEFPRPQVVVTPTAPSTLRARVGRPVVLRGAVRPRAFGSSVALQTRGGDGVWRTVRVVPLRAAPGDTVYEATVVPPRAGTTAWRAAWRGGGGRGVSAVTTVVAR